MKSKNLKKKTFSKKELEQLVENKVRHCLNEIDVEQQLSIVSHKIINLKKYYKQIKDTIDKYLLNKQSKIKLDIITSDNNLLTLVIDFQINEFLPKEKYLKIRNELESKFSNIISSIGLTNKQNEYFIYF